MKAIIVALATATLLAGAANAVPRGKVNNTGHAATVFSSPAETTVLAPRNFGSQNTGANR